MFREKNEEKKNLQTVLIFNFYYRRFDIFPLEISIQLLVCISFLFVVSLHRFKKIVNVFLFIEVLRKRQNEMEK